MNEDISNRIIILITRAILYVGTFDVPLLSLHHFGKCKWKFVEWIMMPTCSSLFPFLRFQGLELCLPLRASDYQNLLLWLFKFHFLQFFILHTCMGACICISIPQRCREEEKFVLCIIMCKAISSFCKRKSRSKRTLKRFQLSLVVAGWKVMGILDTGNVLANSKNVQTLDIKKGIERTLLSNFDILICFNLPFWLVMKSSSGQ